jgi:hypothetical protein
MIQHIFPPLQLPLAFPLHLTATATAAAAVVAAAEFEEPAPADVNNAFNRFHAPPTDAGALGVAYYDDALALWCRRYTWKQSIHVADEAMFPLVGTGSAVADDRAPRTKAMMKCRRRRGCWA